MGLYDNVERAARDPHYRLLYEHRQRQEKITREVEQALKRALSPRGTKTTESEGFSFDFTGSSGTSAPDPVSDEAFGTGLAIGVVIILGLYACSIVASYWYLILRGAGILALAAGAIWFGYRWLRERFRSRIGN